ncbi:OsmC family protein [Cryobacterium sp. Hz9]|uniref:OsmC family protein n=1 Tax=Cryobacterium sp. Hz9 TaxID=1259167 RepID=UPI00106C0B6B|nr:OsmC family protein [Cryobacterium sp. Hz9]TFB65703.1 osmotically inducible protein C [Cryobacterium sp. Hz9]
MTDSGLFPGGRVGPGSVSVSHTGARSFAGQNERGDTVRIGSVEVPEHFTPGALFKLALAGCAGMSSDRVIARRLGENFAEMIWAHDTSDEKEDRYFAADEEIVLYLDALSVAERNKLMTIIRKSIDSSCTISRSVRDSVEFTLTVDGSER